MKLTKDEYTGERFLEFSLGKDRPGSLVHFVNDWPQLFKREEYNWRTFHLIHLYIEDDQMLGAVELQAMLLGFGFRVRLGLKNTERLLEIQERVKEIESLPHHEECNCQICQVTGE